MLVSVIIPTYGRSDMLPRAIQSALSQTHAGVEVVVVDDNPPDSGGRASTRLAMARFDGDGRVRYIENPRNMGGSRARNEGIRAARGAYISFLDDDDFYLPEKLAPQVEAMGRLDLDLCFMDATLRSADGAEIEAITHDLPEAPDGEALLAAHLTEHLTPTATYLFKAEALRRIGGFDEASTGQEFLLMLKAIERGLRIGYVKRSEVVQIIHGGARITTGADKAEGERSLYAVKKRYFPRLTRRQRRRVEVRHYATLCFAHFSRRSYIKASLCAAAAALISPPSAYRLFAKSRRRALPRSRRAAGE